MNQIETGKFIAACRREKNLTQAQLAEQLGITDRAVSKWETGRCLPDSSIMLELCRILGITVNELLSGEEINVDDYQKKADENLITLKKKNENNMKLRALISIVFTLAMVIGIAVCFICDVAISGRLTWSIISVSSIAYGWVVCCPCMMLGKNGFAASLIAVSIFTLPYLWLLSRILDVAQVFSVGVVAITLVSIAFWWIVYAAFRRTRLFKALGMMFLLLIPLSFAINLTLAKLTAEPRALVWDLLNAFILLAAAFICFVLDYAKKNDRL